MYPAKTTTYGEDIIAFPAILHFHHRLAFSNRTRSSDVFIFQLAVKLFQLVCIIRLFNPFMRDIITDVKSALVIECLVCPFSRLPGAMLSCRRRVNMPKNAG